VQIIAYEEHITMRTLCDHRLCCYNQILKLSPTKPIVFGMGMVKLLPLFSTKYPRTNEEVDYVVIGIDEQYSEVMLQQLNQVTVTIHSLSVILIIYSIT